MTPERIKEIRLHLDKSQTGLANLLGSTVTSVWRWENGKSKPAPVFQAKLDKLEKYVFGEKQNETV